MLANLRVRSEVLRARERDRKAADYRELDDGGEPDRRHCLWAGRPAGCAAPCALFAGCGAGSCALPEPCPAGAGLSAAEPVAEPAPVTASSPGSATGAGSRGFGGSFGSTM